MVPVPDGLHIKISVREGERRDEIRSSVEREIRRELLQVDVAVANMRVELVDVIERAGTGAKEKLVARSG